MPGLAAAATAVVVAAIVAATAAQDDEKQNDPGAVVAESVTHSRYPPFSIRRREIREPYLQYHTMSTVKMRSSRIH